MTATKLYKVEQKKEKARAGTIPATLAVYAIV
jgi:hypothetical protein